MSTPAMRRVMFSSMRENWRTPVEIFNALDREFHFTMDVCADRDHPLRQDILGFLGTEGLSWPWAGFRCFMNPPYGREISKWMTKAELEGSRALVVALVPCRTDTRWFWETCLGREIRVIRGRLHFDEAKGGAPFPSCVVIFDPEHPKPARA